MAKNIKTILNKKGWTGKEVGLALLMSLQHDIENKGNPKKKPLFSQEDFNRMVDSINTEYQYTHLKVYEGIYSAIVDSFNYNEAMKQQFYHGYFRYFLAIREAQRAESFYTTTESFPLILTQEQYNQIAKEAGACKRENPLSYYDLFFYTVEHFVNAMELEQGDTIPEEARAAIIATQNQLATNERILANWAEDLGEGYYTLPDGRRSDEMPLEEWQAALEAEFMKTHELYIDGVLQDAKATAQHFNANRTLSGYRTLYKGRETIIETLKDKGIEPTEENIEIAEETLEELIDGLEPITNGKKHGNGKAQIQAAIEGGVATEWHYSEAPTDLTKYDVLVDMLGRYSGGHSDRLYNGEYVDEIPEREQLKEFKRDYPALADAVKDYLEQRVPKAVGLKANQLYKNLITWGELADISYLDFEKLVAVDDLDIIEHYTREKTTENLNKRKRGSFHGIAILKEARNADTGADGSYLDPVEDGLGLDLLQSIDYLEKNPDEAEFIQANLDYLAFPALRFMYAYNAFIDIISMVYDVDFMKVAKIDLEPFESQIEACNNMLYMLYCDTYGTRDDKKRKRAFLREYFKPIEVDELKPLPEKVEALRTKLEEMGYTRAAAQTIKHYRSLVAEIIREGAPE